MSRGSAIIAILIAFVGGLAIGHLTGTTGGGGEVAEDVELSAEAAGAAKAAAGDVERFKVPVTDAQPVAGPDDALVTIVEFSEFQCPFCNKVLPTVNKIKDEYGDKVRFVWRNNPLPMHDNAPMAAQAAMEAYDQGGDEKFWEMHDILFNNQRALSRSDLEGYAEQVGLNMGEFKKALDSNEHKSQVDKDQKLAQSLGARGTPAFFINGRKLMGAQPYAKFKEQIDDEIERAEKMVGAGVPKSRLYGEFIKNAKSAPGDGPDKAKQPQKKRRPDPSAVYKVPLENHDPQKGPKNALVTIVEFSEFQCPFCKRVGPTVDKVLEKYGNDVRIVWKDNPLPFHDNALPASIAAHEAYQQKGAQAFWKMHDLLFENQKQLTRPNLEKFAKQVGLNMTQFKAALDNEEHKEDIEADQKLGRSLGATGTPAFFINGRNIRGAQPLQAFTKVIDEELKKAKAKVEGGTPRSQIYQESIKNGATSQQFIEAEGGGGQEAAKKPSADKEYDIATVRDAPFKGARNAEVVIQEFSDFQCPFCSRVNPTVKQVMDEYGDKVKIVWRNYPLPFHQQADEAAIAAWEVYKQGGNAKFWAYHDILFENQKSLTPDNLVKFAGQVGGINTSKVRSAIDNRTHENILERDKKAISDAGARIGTPSFFINGKLVQGAQPFPAFKSKIDAALGQ